MIDDTLGLCGTVVAEKYEVLEAVGRGGFAIVYRARHLLWKRPVALKVFKELEDASGTDRQALTDALVREASLLAELSEKTASICQARDLGMLVTPYGQSLPYMVLEWLEGKNLLETLVAEQEAALPPRSMESVVALLDPVAEGLAVAHSRGIAHRDVKPANVFLSTSEDGTVSVKLLDFGIAKVVQDAQKTGGAFHKTEGHVTAFTPKYGAPEQFSRRFGATGPWTDVFSLALVLVECAAGRRIALTNDFVDLAAVATDVKHRPTPRNFGVSVSDATEAVFLRALAVEPSGRYASAGEFWVALLTSLGLAPSRSLLTSLEGQDQRLFNSGIPARAATSTESSQGTFRSGTTRATDSSPPRRTSGKTVLAVGAIAGVLFIAAMYAGLRYDRMTSGPPPAAAAEAVSEHTVSSAPRADPTVSSAAAAVSSNAKCPGGMVLIPGGEFFMGSDEDGENEKPAHHVELSPYCIDLYEVTTARYAGCSDQGKCKRAPRGNEWAGITERDREIFDPLCSARDATSQAEHPVVCVDWSMANTFCRSLPGGRLPSEAEWEFAARGPDGRKYPWGDDPPSAAYLNACGSECADWAKQAKYSMTPMYGGDDGWPNTSQVGAFPRGRSRFGLYDVAGNVWEWVADWQGPYGKASERDPHGPATGKARVIRGGAWNGETLACVKPTFRFMNAPESRSYGVGFRCAASPQ